jgi:hypothetical protein
VSLSTPSTSFTLNVDSGPTGGPVTASVDTGTPMDGPGSPPENTGCSGYTPQSPDWYGFNVTDTGQSKTFNWTVKNSDPGTFQVCFGAPYQFDVLNSDNNLVGALPGTLPDGTSGFVGLLPQCEVGIESARLQQEEGPVFICANISQDKVTPTTTDVSVFIPEGLDGDPWAGR